MLSRHILETHQGNELTHKFVHSRLSTLCHCGLILGLEELN